MNQNKEKDYGKCIFILIINSVNDLKMSLLSGQSNNISNGKYTQRVGRMLGTDPIDELNFIKKWCEKMIKRCQDRGSQLYKCNCDSTYIEEIKSIVGMEMGVSIFEVLHINEKLKTISEDLLEKVNEQYSKGEIITQK